MRIGAAESLREGEELALADAWLVIRTSLRQSCSVTACYRPSLLCSCLAGRYLSTAHKFADVEPGLRCGS